MIRLFLISIIFFIVNNLYSQDLNASYFNYESRIGLRLQINTFEVIQSESWEQSSILIANKIFEGAFFMTGDTVKLIFNNGVKMNLFLKNECILNVVDSPFQELRGVFFLVAKYHLNNCLKESGGWRNGKKHGVWMSLNDKGEVLGKKLYKKGKLKNDDFKYKWEK
jgi:hypothetical protein